MTAADPRVLGPIIPVSGHGTREMVNGFLRAHHYLRRGVPGWRVALTLRDSGRKWCQTQGYDLRIVARDERLAPLLADYKPWDLAFSERRVYCAWDYIGNEAPVRKGIERLLAAGFRPREVTCYTIVGFNTSHDQDLHRFNVLWGEYGVHPFVMPYNNRRDDPWIRAFARYVNRRVYKACRWEDYRHGSWNGASRAEAPKEATS